MARTDRCDTQRTERSIIKLITIIIKTVLPNILRPVDGVKSNGKKVVTRIIGDIGQVYCTRRHIIEFVII